MAATNAKMGFKPKMRCDLMRGMNSQAVKQVHIILLFWEVNRLIADRPVASDARKLENRLDIG